MDNLSGGEKTVAALALLFSIHRYMLYILIIIIYFIISLSVIDLLHFLYWTRLMQH